MVVGNMGKGSCISSISSIPPIFPFFMWLQYPYPLSPLLTSPADLLQVRPFQTADQRVYTKRTLISSDYHVVWVTLLLRP